MLRLRGEEAWKYDTLCAYCRSIIPPSDEVYVVGQHVFHQRCLKNLLSKPKHEFEEALRNLPLDTHEELRKLYEGKQELPPRGTGLEVGTARQGEERGEGKPLTEEGRALRHREVRGEVRPASESHAGSNQLGTQSGGLEGGGKKPVPPEVEDLADVVRRECGDYEELLEKIRSLRTRPYSRIAAIVFKSLGPTLAEVCEKGPREPRYSEIGVLYEYVSKLGVCGKPTVTVYRAARGPIAPGDWVYLERGRAEDFAEYLGVKVYEKEVRPEDVVWAGTSPDEWFYIPKELQGYWENLRDFWRSVADPNSEKQGEGRVSSKEERVLSREERRKLWGLARSIVDEALKEAGVRHPSEMRVDGLGPDYGKFLLALRERVLKLLRKPQRVEMRVETYGRGFGDTHIFIDGEYLYTWRPEFDTIRSSFWGWVKRVYNLLKTLAEMGLLREEATQSTDEFIEEVVRSRPEVLT